MDRNQAHKLIMVKIKKALKEKGISQSKLADEVGCDKTAISHYINGQRVPTADILISICSVLDISFDEIVHKKSSIDIDDSIPTDSKSIMRSLTILSKSNLINGNNTDVYGGIAYTIDDFYFITHKFLNELDRYSGTKYTNVDQIYNDLINTYSNLLDERIKNSKK